VRLKRPGQFNYPPLISDKYNDAWKYIVHCVTLIRDAVPN